MPTYHFFNNEIVFRILLGFRFKSLFLHIHTVHTNIHTYYMHAYIYAFFLFFFCDSKLVCIGEVAGIVLGGTNNVRRLVRLLIEILSVENLLGIHRPLLPDNVSK
jgi:hypothetical protein